MAGGVFARFVEAARDLDERGGEGRACGRQRAAAAGAGALR